MKELSEDVRKNIDAVRRAAALHPVLSFTLDPEPSAAAGGWRVGCRRDGSALIVTPTRRAMMIDQGVRVRLYDWLRWELAAARAAASELSDDAALALVGAPATRDELCARFLDGAPGEPLSEEELLELLGANDDRDFHLDEPPRLDDWLPADVSPAQALSWRRLFSDDASILFLTEDGLAWWQDGELARIDLREATLRVFARPHREKLLATLSTLEREVPEPWSWVGLIGLCLVISPLAGLGSLVGGVIVAAVIAVAGFALSTAGVPIPDPPSIEWLIGAPAVGLLAIINAHVVLTGARD